MSDINKKHKLHNRCLKIRFDGEKYSIIYPKGFVLKNGQKYKRSYTTQHMTEKYAFDALSSYFELIESN